MLKIFSHFVNKNLLTKPMDKRKKKYFLTYFFTQFYIILLIYEKS